MKNQSTVIEEMIRANLISEEYLYPFADDVMEYTADLISGMCGKYWMAGWIIVGCCFRWCLVCLVTSSIDVSATNEAIETPVPPIPKVDVGS